MSNLTTTWSTRAAMPWGTAANRSVHPMLPGRLPPILLPSPRWNDPLHIVLLRPSRAQREAPVHAPPRWLH